MKTQFQILAWTAALSVLIWVYADRSGYETRDLGPVSVRVVTPPGLSGDYVLRTRSGSADGQATVRVDLAVNGPKSEVDRLERENNNRQFELQVVLSEELKVGSVSLDLTKQLQNHSALRRRGLSVVGVAPGTVELEVDRYREVSMGIVLDTGVYSNMLETQPTLEPRKITVRVLESDLQRVTLPEQIELFVEEEIQRRRSQGAGRDGRPFSFQVPLRSSLLGIEADFEPDEVEATVRLKQLTEIERITVRPLKVMVGAADFFEHYRIEFQDQSRAYLTQVVWLRVPLEKVGRLRPAMINAYVEIKEESLPETRPGSGPSATVGPWMDGQVRFDLPAGYEDVSIERQQQETVTYRVIKKPSQNTMEALSTGI
jgi:hypothetical protein